MKTGNSVAAILSAIHKAGHELGETPMGNLRRLGELYAEVGRLEDVLADTPASTPNELAGKLGELVAALEAKEVGDWCVRLARSCAADAAVLGCTSGRNGSPGTRATARAMTRKAALATLATMTGGDVLA